METKPFSLQSPEQIAKDYSGNKQKIAEAMQMGILDPTAGTLAAMFIDRMRSAAQEEGIPQQTVAQQVFAPPMVQPPQIPTGAPPAGLGATPEAAAMGMGAPPMDPQGAMPPEMGMMPPQDAGLGAVPPPGMAMGGAISNDMFSAPYMGGVATLPVPDGMFDEPTNGGYRGGGLVAFQRGGPVDEEEDDGNLSTPSGQLEILVPGATRRGSKAPKVEQGMRFESPERFGDLSGNIFTNLDTVRDLAPRETKRAEEYAESLERQRSPEERERRRKEDMWMALGQIGAKMATTPGSLLQAAGAGIGEALPGIREAAKERREDERAAFKALLDEERATNKEISEQADKALEMLKQYSSLEVAYQDMNFRNMMERLSSTDRRYVAQVAAAAGIRSSEISASASRFGSTLALEREESARNREVVKAVMDNIKSGPGYGAYVRAVQGGTGTEYLKEMYQALGGTGNFGGDTPTPPPGFEPD